MKVTYRRGMKLYPALFVGIQKFSNEYQVGT